MNLTHTEYIELPAPLDVVRAALSDITTWEALPLGVERLGELWRGGGELYTVTFRGEQGPPSDSGSSCVLRWEALSAGRAGLRFLLEVTLHDAICSCHAVVRTTLTGPGFVWPWHYVALTQQMRGQVQAAGVAFQVLLREQMLAPAAGETLEMSVATADAVGVPLAAQAGGPSARAPFEAAPHREAALPALDTAEDLAGRLRARYPQTVAHFEAMGALDHLERVWRLEQGWKRVMHGEYDASCYALLDDWNAERQKGQTRPSRPSLMARLHAPVATEYDLIYAGGGLSLLHAAVMAQCYGWRVLVFDRGEVGCAHREWNISRRELQALVDMGLVTWDELADVIMREYNDGIVRFHAGPFNDNGSYVPCPVELRLPEVLNVALDAGALLRLMRRKLEAAGGTILSRRAFRCVRVKKDGPLQVEVELEPIVPERGTKARSASPSAVETYRARLLLDGMGSTSPLALLRHAGHPFAGVCPTVGSVASGLAQGNGLLEYDPNVGDILISVADSQSGQQMMWEGFPGRGDELTVYLFYYSTLQPSGAPPTSTLHPPSYSLLELFEQYFGLLPSYKQPGPNFEHVKPVYGYIPSRHSLRRTEAPLLRGVLPVGDAAAQQSPLTFCGFGSHVRNLNRTTSLLDYALRRELLEPAQLRHINAFQVNVSLNWIFSRFMHPWNRPQDVNQLQNIFLSVLNDMGADLATRFFQDRMRWGDYHPMLWEVMLRYLMILRIALRVLGPRGIYRWICDYLRFTGVAAVATLARTAGQGVERALYAVYDRIAPTLGLRVRAHYAEWRAMGWV